MIVDTSKSRTDNKKQLITLLEAMKPQLKLILPAPLSVDRVSRIALTEFSRNPKLQECTPISFVSALMMASQLGLEIGLLNSAFIVPYKGVCNLIIGYRGFLELCYRNDRIISVSPKIIYENDQFDYCEGTDSRILHKPTLNNRGKVIGVYAIAKLVGGETQHVVLNKQDIDNAKARSKTQTGPWVTDYEAMALKTAIRRIYKWLPLTIEMKTAAILDEHSDLGIQNLDAALEENNLKIINQEGDSFEQDKPTETTQEDELAEMLKNG
jgi:recombination protein RecT